MKYGRFEELPVWRQAIDLAETILKITGDGRFGGQGDLRSQLQRAAISIGNNIAEGFERGTTGELITFLYIARGSAGEIRSMLHLMERLPRFQPLEPRIARLKSQCESISRQLRAWADNLQNSPIRGQRYLTQAERERHARRARRDAFLKRLQDMTSQPRDPPTPPGASPA